MAYAFDLTTILDNVTDLVMQLVEGDEASIMLPTPEGAELVIAAVRGEGRDTILGQHVPLEQSIAGWVARTRQPLTLHGAVHDRRFAPLHPRDDITAIVVPMLAAGKLVGVLNVNALHRRCPFTFGQVKAVNILGNLAAAALEGALLYAEVRQAEEKERSIEEELRRRTEALYQSEKLATMGQLLAGVAHELNNPLSVVQGQAALLCEGAGDGSIAARAEKIAQAANRCARIVKNFLALARQDPLERHTVKLNQVVQEAVELLAYPLRVDNIEVGFDLADELPLLWADPHQLHQVVVNLVVNAHQAMHESPPPRQLTLATECDPAQGRVTLRVADTGPGIPAAIQAHIFEPFFTTKPPGKGTGLGLHICQEIVESHRGSIRVASQPGQGAVFVVELPVDAPPVAVAETPSPTSPRARRH